MQNMRERPRWCFWSFIYVVSAQYPQDANAPVPKPRGRENDVGDAAGTLCCRAPCCHGARHGGQRARSRRVGEQTNTRARAHPKMGRDRSVLETMEVI